MKIIVSRDELLKRLSDIQGIVEKKTTMPILSHFLLDSMDNPLIYATDLETAVKLPLKAEVLDKGVVTVPARPFISMVKELDEEIVLESTEKQWITVSSGKYRTRLASLDSQEFPRWPEIQEGIEITLSSSIIDRIIESVSYAASENDTRYVFNGILLEIRGDSLKAVGTDGHRLALIKLPIGAEDSSGQVEEIKVILPKRAAMELRRLLKDGDVKLKVGKNHILFEISEGKFLTRVIEGTYPNYEQVIPKKVSKKFLCNKESLAKALKRASIISRDRSNAIKFDINDNLLRISSSNPDVGEAEEEINVEYSGETFTIGFNARFILDALGEIDDENVLMAFNEPLGPSLLRGEKDDSYLCVIMPMRI